MSKAVPEPRGPFTVKLTYFKPDTGAHATSAQYETYRAFPFEIVAEVRAMHERGALPGLRAGFRHVMVMVELPQHEHASPVLLFPRG